jgi:shikimate dehydrogenase
VPEDAHIVINATSIGLFPDVDARLDLDVSTLQNGMVVADVIPNPPRTHLVRDAQARGCKVIDGLGMLVNQGVIGVQYWSGIEPDAGVMRKALEDVFGAE